jgi:hypothetical protein
VTTPHLRIPNLDDGDQPVTFRFCDLAPRERYVHFTQVTGRWRTLSCDGLEDCMLCRANVKRLHRFEWTVSTQWGNRLLDCGRNLADEILTVGVLLGVEYVLHRTGRAVRTRFHFDFANPPRSN